MTGHRSIATLMANVDIEAVIAELHANATRSCGLDDFGSKDYEKPFSMLAEAMWTTPMSQGGRVVEG